MPNKGYKVFVGSEYNVRVAPSTSSTDKVDFTQKDSVKLIFPTSTSIKKEVEIVETSRLGIPTPLKYLGKTQIAGDMGDVATPNGVGFYTSMTLGGIIKSEANDKALVSIESDGKMLLTWDAGAKTLKIKVEDTAEDTFANLTTVKSLVDAVNAIANNKYLAVLHIGTGDEAIDITETSINSTVRAFLTCGALSEDYKKTVAPFITYIIPRRGDPRYFNILETSNRAPMSMQFWGCRFLSLGYQFQNSNLTNVTANIWGGYTDDFTGTPTQAEVDDMQNVYAQTNGHTTCYMSKQKADTVASVTNTFQWNVEPAWNIKNEPYEIAVSKYTDSYDVEAMFNEQSKELFQNRVNNKENLSIMLDTNLVIDGKSYKFIKHSSSLLGQPQYPDIADGVIQLNASGFTAVATMSDPYSSMFIITGDKRETVTYKEAQILKDFSAYVK